MLVKKILYNKKSRYLLWIIYFVFLTIVIYKYITLPTENMLTVDGKYRIRDFDYYMIIIKSYLYGNIDTMYNKKAQLIALNDFFKIKTAVAMPMGISPTVLFIFLPFALFFELNKMYSYTMWVSFSIFSFSIAINKFVRYTLYKNKMMIPWLLIRLSFFLFSFAMIVCVVHGQTTIMACALLMFLIIEIYKAKDEKRILRPWIYILILFFLSIKAPYMILGLGILFVFGHIYEFMLSILVIIISFIMIGIWTGITLYQDWFQQLSVFHSSLFIDHYHMTRILDTMINFRTAFSRFFGSDLSFLISKLFLIFGIIFVFFISFIRFFYPLYLKKTTSKITSQQIAVLLVAILLLFIPYMGEYEDLLLIILFIIGGLSIAPYRSSSIRNFLIAICLCSVLNYKLFQHWNLSLIFWWMKFFIFASFFIDLKGNIMENMDKVLARK